MEYQTFVQHVMWQPTASCTHRCDGCYISKSDTFDTSIVEKVYIKKEISCMQFTVALDTLLKYEPSILLAIKAIWKRYPDDSLPELCVTAFNWATILCWCRELQMSPKEFLRPVSILSLSNMPVLGKNCFEIQEICQETKTKMNFNYMVKGGEAENKAFEMGIRYSDQVYLVLKKPALGEVQNETDLKNWLVARKIAKEMAPEKLIEDVCVMDSLHHTHTGQTCNAGSGKLHAWPNGKCTGCPYDTNQICKDGDHPMSYCKISEALSAVTGA